MNEVIMVVENGFKIFGKGTAVIGKILPDKVRIGSTIKVTDADGGVLQEAWVEKEDVSPGPGMLDWLFGNTHKPRIVERTHPLRIVAIETFNKTHEEATQGQEVALLLRGVTFKPEKGMMIVRGDIEHG